jgi:putative methyltransferase
MARLVHIYKEVANVLDEVAHKKGSIQKFAGGNSTVYALAHEVTKFQDILDQIILESKILKDNAPLKKQKTLLRVAVYDLLMGKNDPLKTLKEFEKITHPMFAIVKKYYSDLNSAFVMIKIDKKVSKNKDLLPKTESIILPRYIRVNTRLSSLKQIETELLLRRFKKVNTLDEVDETSYQLDPHLPNLIAISSSIKWHHDPLMKSGKIVIQDKASCLPSYLMYECMTSQNLIGDVIDACAAPGNKTSHIAACLPKQKIYAFDKDSIRLEILTNLKTRCQLDNISEQNIDFLKVNPLEYKSVRGIILDPSCSGSGIPNREQISEEDLTRRLMNLSSIQKRFLQHAFSFPGVQLVTYSTCSIHDDENEKVVDYMLTMQDEFVLLENVMPEWKTRGKEEYEFGKHVLRAYPDQDKTRNGFFVAVFVRSKKRKTDTRELPNKKLK